MGPVNSNRRTSNFFLFRATALLLVIVVESPVRPQARPAQPHPPYQAILAVSQVQVPDVRGRQAESANGTLRKAGLI